MCDNMNKRCTSIMMQEKKKRKKLIESEYIIENKKYVSVQNDNMQETII